MSSQSSVPLARPASAFTRLRPGITFAGYALLLLAAALSIPLRIPEILQIAGMRELSLARFFGWIAQAPGSSPLHPILQLPVLLAGGPSRLAARFISLLFAVAACYLFLQLVKRVPLDRPYWALPLFMLLPAHFELSFLGQPFEQALFLVVLATGCFFRLVFDPNLRTALCYAACLTLCLYTDRYSFLPAIGYLLFLLRFVNRTQERRAMWYALAATAAPVLLFLPYALWARTQVSADWLTRPVEPLSGTVAVPAVGGFAEEMWATYVLTLLLGIGVMVGSWASFRVTGGAITRRIRLFALSGGVCGTILIALALDLSLGQRFAASQLLWTTPAVVILLFAGLEWLAKRRALRSLTIAASILITTISAGADAQFLLRPFGSAPREDLQALAIAVPGQLKQDSCVVFVSQRFSKALFLTFEPELGARECLDFFHSRIVLASHPYVTSAQQEDAESYFRGLDMAPTRRLQAGGGQIVVMQQHN